MTRCPHCFAPLAPPPPPAAAPVDTTRWWARRETPAPGRPPGGFHHCPHCGEELPRGWAEVTTVVLVMAGARTTGKSIFIAVMMRQFEQYAATLGVDLRPASPAVARRFDEVYVAPLYEQRGIMEATVPEGTADAYQREPLVFDLVTKVGRRIRLVIRDVAGEDLEVPHEAAPGSFDYFQKADCVFFLFDPLKVQAIADTLADTIPAQQLGGSAKAVLDTTLHLMEGSPARLAVIMSKFDVMQALRAIEGAGEWARILRNPGSTLSRDRGPNPQDAELLHEEVRSLLLKLEATTFVTAVERTMFHRPGSLQYFAISALGESPNGEVLHARGIAPFRCLDPVFWALAGSSVFL